jgi:hypothetical protein
MKQMADKGKGQDTSGSSKSIVKRKKKTESRDVKARQKKAIERKA